MSPAAPGSAAAASPIPALPDLAPADVLPGRRRSTLFPLDGEELELTYLGRNAVWRAVKRLGLEGREVVVPAYHHGVEVEALLHAGARPRFARVDRSGLLDPEDVRTLVGPRTAAIYVIHYAGFPQPIGPLAAIAREARVALVEDCALALFSSDGARPLGDAGDAAVFCFYKTLPVPHGGGLWVRDAPRLAPPVPPPLLPTLSTMVGSTLATVERRLGRTGRALRAGAKALTRRARARAHTERVPVGTQRFDPALLPLGMSPLAAHVLRRADAREVVRRRREHWSYLHERLGMADRALWRELPGGVCPLFYAVEVEDKDRALAELWSRDIEAVDFWRFGHPAAEPGRFPEVQQLRRHVLELPCHQDLDAGQLERLVRDARAVLGRGRKVPRAAPT